MAYLILENCIGCTACVRLCPVDAITGERKQMHTIDPALCIECGACGRICPADCIQDGHGVLTQQIKPALWAKPAFIYERCTACRICVQSCPVGCIALINPAHSNGLHPGQPYLATPKTCISCAFCVTDCPTNAMHMLAPLPAVDKAH